MQDISRRQLLVWSAVSTLPVLPQIWAQGPRSRTTLDPERKIDTRVSVELITEQGAGLNAQEWATIFQELDVEFSVRRSLLDDKPETKEATSGISLRDVQVTGRLERDGTVTFADRRYRPADVAKIRDWIQGLKAYGAQGSPKGQPMWGLTKNQFDPLFQACGVVIKTDPQLAALNGALEGFALRKRYPMRFTAEATAALEKTKPKDAVERSYVGISEGTGLAAVLNEFGLGFHPQRTPSGKLELAIAPLTTRTEIWPVGWPLADDPPKIAPELFKSGQVDLDQEPFGDVLQAIGDLVQLPVLIDEYGLTKAGVNFRDFKVSHKPRKTIWSAALKHICFQARCKWELRIDEAGHPLLWIMSSIPVEKSDKS